MIEADRLKYRRLFFAEHAVKLELFFNEYNPIALENDENQLNGVHMQTNNSNYPQLVEEQQMEDDIAMPSGILENLSVDLPDTSSASQLAYYSTPALQQDVYRNFSNPKGLALIINNYKFQQHNSFIRNRDGTEVDKRILPIY
uniref:Caspase family p20 domain-containing protein n=1 Tax=Ditylenchus dipsaci TaxID=166011 RepID=A0A915EM61_9BILA